MVAQGYDVFAGISLSPRGQAYVIAEIGVNHEGSLDRAKRLIDLAKDGGAHAAKFQTYKAGKLTIEDSPAYWDQGKEPTSTQHELFLKYDVFEESDYVELARYCRGIGIDFLSTPFDLEAVDFLDPLVPLFKVASADITNLPLLRKIGGTGKPVVLSTGASDLEEISWAVEVLSKAGALEVALLHCILSYPTPNEHANLAMIGSLKENFPNCVVGYSDHTAHDNRTLPCLVAHLAGALIIEKHFTDDKALPGNDHYHAMDSSDLRWLTRSLSDLLLLTGAASQKAPIEIEGNARRDARRSLVTARPLEIGHEILQADLMAKRPGRGLSPSVVDDIIGRTTSRSLPRDWVLDWDDLAPPTTGSQH